MAQWIPAETANEWVTGDEEVAFVDVREVARYGEGHPLLAANVPLSTLEIDVLRVVPRTSTRIVLTDGDGSLTELAANALERVGYNNVHILEGGASGWIKSGLTLFPEIEVPGKAFGAFAREAGRPQSITPAALKRALAANEDVVVLDSRPHAEYARGNIPGSIAAPAGEALRCFKDLVPSPSTKVVINCMSATRGTLGALMLNAANVPNPVFFLQHGTRGWQLDEHELEVGAMRHAKPPSAEALAFAQEKVAAMLKRARVPVIDTEQWAAWKGDGTRTTFTVDVRTPGEFAAGHVAGSLNAPEGAVVMGPQEYFATLNARVVLLDDDGVRAGVAASWLSQMGLAEVYVLRNGLRDAPIRKGPYEGNRPSANGIRRISAEELDLMRENGSVRLVDVGHSHAYARQHIPGARWCSRAEAGAFLMSANFAFPTVLTSEDGLVAELTAVEFGRSLSVLRGGNESWASSGRELTNDHGEYLCARHDRWLASSERPGDQKRNVIDYLGWEDELMRAVERAGKYPFKNLLWI